MRYKLVPTRQVPSLVRILTTRRNKITIMEYLDFNPSTSSLLRTRASDCANSPDDWEYPAVRAATFYGTCARAATYDERSVESSRLAQLVERKTLNLVVVGSIPTVGVIFVFLLGCPARNGRVRSPVCQLLWRSWQRVGLIIPRSPVRSWSGANPPL